MNALTRIYFPENFFDRDVEEPSSFGVFSPDRLSRIRFPAAPAPLDPPSLLLWPTADICAPLPPAPAPLRALDVEHATAPPTPRRFAPAAAAGGAEGERLAAVAATAACRRGLLSDREAGHDAGLSAVRTVAALGKSFGAPFDAVLGVLLEVLLIFLLVLPPAVALALVCPPAERGVEAAGANLERGVPPELAVGSSPLSLLTEASFAVPLPLPFAADFTLSSLVPVLAPNVAILVLVFELTLPFALV